MLNYFKELKLEMSETKRKATRKVDKMAEKLEEAEKKAAEKVEAAEEEAAEKVEAALAAKETAIEEKNEAERKYQELVEGSV